VFAVKFSEETKGAGTYLYEELLCYGWPGFCNWGKPMKEKKEPVRATPPATRTFKRWEMS
jgi:hypothetical protein